MRVLIKSGVEVGSVSLCRVKPKWCRGLAPICWVVSSIVSAMLLSLRVGAIDPIFDLGPGKVITVVRSNGDGTQMDSLGTSPQNFRRSDWLVQYGSAGTNWHLLGPGRNEIFLVESVPNLWTVEIVRTGRVLPVTATLAQLPATTPVITRTALSWTELVDGATVYYATKNSVMPKHQNEAQGTTEPAYPIWVLIRPPLDYGLIDTAVGSAIGSAALLAVLVTLMNIWKRIVYTEPGGRDA